jgi:hypothetical protein
MTVFIHALAIKSMMVDTGSSLLRLKNDHDDINQ